MEYKAQYQEYLLQATAALDAASARFLPEESEVCRAARYSLLGGGKRIPRNSDAQRLRYAGRRDAGSCTVCSSCGDAALLLADPRRSALHGQ